MLSRNSKDKKQVKHASKTTEEAKHKNQIQVPSNLELDFGDSPTTLFCAAASGSTAINYLASDPKFAEEEAQIVLEAARKQTKK